MINLELILTPIAGALALGIAVAVDRKLRSASRR